MKKIIAALCCIFGSASFAQNNSSITTTEEPLNWPVMVANLPNSQVTSGVLLDKVVDYSNLTNYNNNAELNISDSKHFTQALSELYTASDQTRFVDLATLNSRTDYTAENTVAVGIINTLFHRLNFNEDDASLTGVNYNGTQFSTVFGKPTFIGKKIFVAAPLKETVSGTSINFDFNDLFVFNNATTLIKNLTLKFGDEGSNAAVSIISNSTYLLNSKNIVYTTTGYKTLEFTATFSDNTTITTYAKLYVNVINLSQSKTGSADSCNDVGRERGIFPSTTDEIANTTTFQGYDESYPFKGKIEYTIFYSYNNTAKKIIKPIIIVDGFDPGDKRKVQDCDCNNDPTCRVGHTKLVSLIPFVSTFDAGTYTSIEDSMDYKNATGGSENFMKDLRTLGYDVIIVNQPTYQIVDPANPTTQVLIPFPFPAHYETRTNYRTIDGGADFIERNALTLVSFIQTIKLKEAAAGSTEKLVLVGPSMGGQITRYALAYMEKKYAETGNAVWQHNARLWVSVDSPHLGANIPVGAQANIWFMASRLGKQEALQSYNELNSPAGKQQSIVNFEYARTSPSHNLAGSPFYTTYYNNVSANGVSGSNGYPVTTSTFRKIAMINGSLTGAKQGGESQTFLYTRIYVKGVWPYQSSTITLARFRDSFMPAYGTVGQVFQGDGQNFSIGFNHWTINHPRYTLNVNNQDVRGSLDVVPGGYFKIGEILKTSIEAGASEAGFRSETNNYIPSNSFISAFSSLGHLNPYQNWANPLNTNLVCPSNKQTPFDSYWGSTTNTEHTTFTVEGVEWLKKELAGNPQAPYFPIQTGLLTGDNLICSGVTKTYSITDICKVPSIATFTVQGNLTIIGSNTGYTVAVQGTSNTPSQATITATFQNGQTITKTITVGAPYISNPNPVISGIYGWYYAGLVNNATATVVANPTATSYRWVLTYSDEDFGPLCSTSNPSLAKITTNGTTVTQFTPATCITTSPSVNINLGNCSASYTLSCYIINECGETFYCEKMITVSKTSPCNNVTAASKYNVWPNPSKNGTVVVNVTPGQIPCDPPQGSGKMSQSTVSNVKDVKIFDMQGNLKFSNSYNEEETFKITGLTLKPGNYILNISTNGKTSKQIIIIE